MTKPGFVRVFIPSRNKTTRIRTGLANNPNYLERNGMVLMPDPVAPPKLPPPFQDVTIHEGSNDAEVIKTQIENGELVLLNSVIGTKSIVVPNTPTNTPTNKRKSI